MPKKKSQSGVGYNSYNQYDLHGSPFSDEDMMMFDDHDLQHVFTSRTLTSITDKNPLDPLFTKTLQLLITFLQYPIPDGTIILFDMSLLPGWINDLARNDSITDMIERQDLYNSMFDFVRHVTKPDSPLASLVFERRPEAPGLQAFNMKANQSLAKIGTSQTSAAWVSCCENTYKQAKLFLKLASKPQLTPHKSKANIDVIRLCEAVVKLYEPIQRESHDPDVVDSWETFWEKNKLSFSHDVLNNHRLYNPVLHMISTPARGRSIAINKELANLQTSLPMGVFLKVDEV